MSRAAKKNTSPCTWENTPPREKAQPPRGKTLPLHVSTPRRPVSRRRGKKKNNPKHPPPPVVRRPGSGEGASLLGRDAHPGGETHVRLALLDVSRLHAGKACGRVLLPAFRAGREGWGAGPPRAAPYTLVVEWGWGSVLLWKETTATTTRGTIYLNLPNSQNLDFKVNR